LLQKLGCHERRIVGGKNVSIVILYPGEANEQIQINAPLEWLGMVEGELQTLRGVRAGGADTTQETLGTGARWSSGSATNPNGSVAGKPGDLFTSTTGGPGASLWVKETGDGTKTGWTAK
jgi:hypothetical protein